MSEIRRDPISGRLVIFATERSKRPAAFAGKGGGANGRAAVPAYLEGCPFCAGNERMTPPELLALGRSTAEPDTAGWRVRVVPNKYPAVMLEEKGTPDFRGALSPGYGAHELLIEIPEHNLQPGSFPPRQMELVVEAYYRRGRALANYRRLRYLQIFRNHRREAGASIEHPHSQLIALPFVPPAVRLELESAHQAYLAEGICPFCRMLEEERQFDGRVILNCGAYTAFIPFAARSPFETWILPRRHEASFFETAASERAELAEFLEELFRLYAHVLGDTPYNYYLHTAPLRSLPLPHYHWHIELIPRVSIAAGFEMGSGVYINVTRPEEAARFLREKGRAEHESWRKDLLYTGLAQSPACRQPG
ncbi:MAG TPA: DUF4921 family protein [Bacillota bacterium]|nr:DUF4921 family protein [Bacillota bacterium]HOL14899.1 DUF4921 family protein [Bacillota bacterium]